MKKNKIIGGIGSIMVLIASLTTIPACNKYDDPPPYFEEPGDMEPQAARKVLVIAIDGAVGQEYKKIEPPVLMGMRAHSKYSWDALSDGSSTSAASWKTLVSGVSYSTHKISDSTFIYSQDEGSDEHAVIPNYPSLFNYIISSARSGLKTSAISQWPRLVNGVLPEVEDKVVASSDAAVKDSAILRLQNEKTDVVIVHFNGPAVAGKASAFSASEQEYKDAVLRVDGYIGELMSTLKARPGYNTSEEWLVVVTGTHGGIGNTHGGPSPEETNVVSFYYMEDFKELELIKPSFSGVQFKGRDAAAVKAVLPPDGGLYNAGNGQQTIQLKVKGTNSGSYPHFFTRMATWPSTPGWSWFVSGGNWAFSVRSVSTGERRIQTATPNILDDKWHTLTVVIYDSIVGGNTSRFVKRFTDGVRIIETGSNETNRNLGTNYGSIETTSPMFLGWGGDRGYGAVNFTAADVMIFNTALTDEEVQNFQCISDISQHPKYGNLIGYWPMNEGGFSNTLRNHAPGGGGPDFELQGPYQWTGFDAPCGDPAPPAGTAYQTIKSVDLVTNMFYWLRIPTATTWKLEGTQWLDTYEIEFVDL